MKRYFENENGILCEVPSNMYISCRKENGILKLITTNGIEVKEHFVNRRVTKKEFESFRKENITTELSRFNIYKKII